jgi:poly(3-hydroxyalkanoate) synthetase
MNQNSEDRDLGLDDYLNWGVMDTLEVVGQVVPCKKHATGYCLAGTLLAAVAAAMGRDSDKRLASITSWLSAGGHNVGIVNPLWLAGRSYQVRIRPHDGKYLEPEAWREAALKHEGSCWPDWLGWLQARSGKPMAAPAKGLVPLCNAPSNYLLQK